MTHVLLTSPLPSPPFHLEGTLMLLPRAGAGGRCKTSSGPWSRSATSEGEEGGKQAGGAFSVLSLGPSLSLRFNETQVFDMLDPMH